MNDSELALLDLVPTPLFVLEASRDGDVIYTFFNKAAIDVAKFTLADYVGLNAKHLYKGRYGEFAYQKHIDCYLTSQPSSYLLQLPIAGRMMAVSTRLMPVLDSDGLVKRIIGASTEVTAEHELDQIRAESRHIEQELQEFAYLAAHDLRSPMKKVHMFANMLREDFKDMGDGKLELINLLEKISMESMSMIQTILKHAQTTGTETSDVDVNLPDICNGILAMLDPTGMHQYRIDDCSVSGDSVMIKTVLRNLIDYALRHNAPECALLDISVRNIKPGYIAMTVADNRKGLYTPSSSFDNVDTETSISGLGFRAVRRLVANSGGSISVEQSPDGKGLAVTVTLPGNARGCKSAEGGQLGYGL